VEGYSEEFEKSFMEHLRRSHPFSRVSAKVVYNEYIADRHHVHMNSTKWYTLTDFVKHLGKTGQCRVDQTEKGWYISVIQEDPAEKLAKERRLKTERAEKVQASEENPSSFNSAHPLSASKSCPVMQFVTLAGEHACNAVEHLARNRLVFAGRGGQAA
jgi:hypothetical protein